MIIKVLLTVIFLVVMIGVGVYSRQQARSVDGFVLGGRAVGPWLTAFAFGTSYFSAVVFVGYAGQFGWKYGLSSATDDTAYRVSYDAGFLRYPFQ